MRMELTSISQTCGEGRPGSPVTPESPVTSKSPVTPESPVTSDSPVTSESHYFDMRVTCNEACFNWFLFKKSGFGPEHGCNEACFNWFLFKKSGVGRSTGAMSNSCLYRSMLAMT